MRNTFIAVPCVRTAIVAHASGSCQRAAGRATAFSAEHEESVVTEMEPEKEAFLTRRGVLDRQPMRLASPTTNSRCASLASVSRAGDR